MAKNKRPSRCTYPDCFSCPYDDCMYDEMTVDEYIDANQRDRENQEHVLTEYKQRSFDCSGRKEYFRNWYQENREHRLMMGRTYRHKTKDSRDRLEYYKEYYRKHQAEKQEKAKKRHRQIQEALNATG